ncbi:MAG: PAS domain S-box protein [Acidobacteriota bacterium]|nr:PAS domain S-box protein [Acidobacteriota bacterium]
MLDTLDLVRDEKRIAALRRYDILDAPADRAFDDITRLATHICSTPVAAINLIDENRQFFISEIGVGVREMGLEVSISTHALAEEDVLVVPDLTSDARFAGRHDPRFRYYAGVPLRTPDGHAVGALCVLDVVPRLLSHQQLDGLRALARQVMTQLELRRTVAAQEKAAAALRESEERFRAAFHHAVIGMVLTDTAGRVLRVNGAFERIVGRTAAELIGRDSYDYTHPDDRNANVQWIRSIGAEEIEYARFEKRYVRKDGSIVWAYVHLSPVADSNGETSSLVAIVEDITEQRRTREELVETRRRLDSALIAGEVATYEWEMNSDRVWGDPNFDRIFGVARDADGTAPLERFIAAIHPDDRAAVQQKIDESVRTRGDYEAEYRIVTAVPERWVIARGRIDVDERDHTQRFHGVVLDISARKRLEEELARRTHIYDAILSTTDDFAYLFDRDGKFLFANRRLLTVWGKTLPEIVGKDVYDLGYPEWHADMHMREIREVIEEKHAITGEVPYTAPTGIFGVYEYIFSPVFGANGEVEVIAGTTRDVTARKRAEEAQRTLAEQLRLALDAARMGWWQVDLDSGRVYWDDRVRAIFELGAEAASYDALRERIHPDDAACVEEAFRTATDPHNPQPYSVQFRVTLPDGTLRWIASKGQATFEGEGESRRATRFVGATLDITESKVAEAALQASESRFRQLADAMPQLVWTADAEGHVDYFNRPFYEYTGTVEGSVGNEAWNDVLHPEDRPRVHEAWSDALARGSRFEAEFRMRRAADGAYRWFVGRALAVRDVATGEVRWFGTSTDVDDQRRLLEENQRLLGSERTARSEAERASRMKDEFLATLSHELRTPLSAILGWSQILADGGNQPEEIAEGVAVIQRNARVQAQIIEDLLEMSRIISGKVRLDVHELEIAEVIDAAIDTVRPAAAAKGVEIVSELDSMPQPLCGDANRLQQVFWNLLSNAVKFTPASGRVSVRLETKHNEVEVRVTDTGEGIRPDFLPYVFDRFRQADASTTRRHAGLGLGLAIVKQIVELHGGTVRASSEGPGKGATFTVALPFLAAHAEAEAGTDDRRVLRNAADAPDSARDQLAGLRILVVDDEEDNLLIAHRIFTEHGAHVSTARSAGDALAALQAAPFDVLVSDIAMPGEDGFSLLRKVREQFPDLPALALTAYARPEDRENVLRAGYDAHLAKPVEASQLVAAVAGIV